MIENHASQKANDHSALCNETKLDTENQCKRFLLTYLDNFSKQATLVILCGFGCGEHFVHIQLFAPGLCHPTPPTFLG